MVVVVIVIVVVVVAVVVVVVAVVAITVSWYYSSLVSRRGLRMKCRSSSLSVTSNGLIRWCGSRSLSPRQYAERTHRGGTPEGRTQSLEDQTLY